MCNRAASAAVIAAIPGIEAERSHQPDRRGEPVTPH